MPRYGIVPERSRVWIDATSSVHGIHSESHGLQGWLDASVDDAGNVNPSVPATAHIELPVRELTSGNALYDREMHRRVDARRFPTITGDLTELARFGSGGRYSARGTVTFRGVTRPMEGEVTITSDDGGALRIAGERMFDIREFGMRPPQILMLKVHPDVSVRIDVWAERLAPSVP